MYSEEGLSSTSSLSLHQIKSWDCWFTSLATKRQQHPALSDNSAPKKIVQRVQKVFAHGKVTLAFPPWSLWKHYHSAWPEITGHTRVIATGAQSVRYTFPLSYGVFAWSAGAFVLFQLSSKILVKHWQTLPWVPPAPSTPLCYVRMTVSACCPLSFVTVYSFW